MAFGEIQGQSAAPSAPEVGLTTVTKDLANALMENASIAENIKNSLGISNPPPNATTGVIEGNASLVSVIRGLTGRVYSTNQNLLDVLRHINA